MNDDDELNESTDNLEKSYNSPISLWNQFENHVKSVNDESSQLLDVQVKVRLQKPSKDFITVQNEILNEKRGGKGEDIAKTSLERNFVCFRTLNDKVLHKKYSDKPLKPPIVVKHQSSEEVKKVAKRSWNKIKRNVEDVKADRKAAKSEQNWDVLKHCLDDMVENEDTVKQRLYNRYLNEPYKWRENLSNYPLSVKIQVEQERRARERNERTISASPRIKNLFSGARSTKNYSSRSVTFLTRAQSTLNLTESSRQPYLKNAWK